MKIIIHHLFLLNLIIAGFVGGCTSNFPTFALGSGSAKTPLVIFAAGSLIIPFQHLESAFENRYPQIDVQAQYHGSIQVMRHATELHEPIDVVATADASLIPMLMYSTNNPDTGQPYATWYLRFASNRLALAYRPDSKYATEIGTENWYEILSRPDVRVGLADPRFDAVGYRTLMVYGLARDYYNQPTIFTDMFKGQFSFPLGIFSDDDLTTITVPEIVETIHGAHIVLRGASMELIALLESGDLDYAFEYESVILQHGLNLFKLPDALNLGEEAENHTYDNVLVTEDSQRFATVKPEFRGERIGYGITIPSNAPHPDEAKLFIEFLLGPDGRSIMQADSHPVFDPALGDNYEAIPTSLQALCIPAETP